MCAQSTNDYRLSVDKPRSRAHTLIMQTKHTAPITCPHCHAFNGRSRCGCAAARKDRGETPSTDTMEALNAIPLVIPARKGAVVIW